MSAAGDLVDVLGAAGGDRAARVWAELLALSRNALVCERTGVVAQRAGISPDTARRALDDLERLGWIEQTGLRDGKARQLRLCVGSPQADAGSPQLALVHDAQAAAQDRDGGGYVVTTPSVGRDRRSIAAADRLTPDPLKKGRHRADCWQDPADRAYLDEYAGPTAEGLQLVRACLERLFGASDGRLGAPAGAGDCDDCGTTVRVRTWLGCFALCASCSARRAHVGAKVAQPKPKSAPASGFAFASTHWRALPRLLERRVRQTAVAEARRRLVQAERELV